MPRYKQGKSQNPTDNAAAPASVGSSNAPDQLSQSSFPPYRYPGGEAAPVVPDRRSAPAIAPGMSVQDYRKYQEKDKQADQRAAAGMPLVASVLAGDPMRPSEPLGAFGGADFTGDNMVDTGPLFGQSGQPAQPTKKAAAPAAGVGGNRAPDAVATTQGGNTKTTPGSSCNSWGSCMDCVQFSFCMWNDEGQSCRQEIDVLFSSVHPKYYKTCAMGGSGERISPARLKEVPATIPSTTYRPYGGFMSGVQGAAQAMPRMQQQGQGNWAKNVDGTGHFEPPYMRRQQERWGLQSDLAQGARAGMWSMAEEHVDWTGPGSRDAATPEYQTVSMPAAGGAIVAREGSLGGNSPNIVFGNQGGGGMQEAASWTGN